MSILSSFYHNDVTNKPNDVHNIPAESPSVDANGTMTSDARRLMQAMSEGHLRPALYYTPAHPIRCDKGVWECRHTVDAKLIEKEEFPLG